MVKGHRLSRRRFLGAAGATAAGLVLGRRGLGGCGGSGRSRPNVVLCMTDDQGWGDTGYNGHPSLRTPILDEMAGKGVRFNRFYAAAPICSPTRGSVLTGRHPNRFGCFLYNYTIRPEEVTLADVLKEAGYATGHFGKWHVGPVRAGSPVNPGECGFEEWVSHDNFFELYPALSRNGRHPYMFEGESSEVIVGEALKFIRSAVGGERPFFTVIWFGSPHRPHIAPERYREAYRDLPERYQHYLGELTAMDRAMGMLREELEVLKVRDNTILWFCSDNGADPPGSRGGLRGTKRMLWEGGIRVPGILEWPAVVKQQMVTDVPCSTLDIYPTIVDLLGLEVAGQVRPIDGVSLCDVIKGKTLERAKEMPFWIYPYEGEATNGLYFDVESLQGWWRRFRNYRHPEAKTGNFNGRAALIGNRFKLHKLEGRYELYDIKEDPGEINDVAEHNAEVVSKMKCRLEDWQRSVERSLTGADYRL